MPPFKLIILIEIILHLLFGTLLYMPEHFNNKLTSQTVHQIVHHHSVKGAIDIMSPVSETTEASCLSTSTETTTEYPSTTEGACPLPTCISEGDCIICEKSSSTILSPGYPNDYGDFRKCVVYITTMCAEKRIRLKFIEFIVEKNHDWINIHDGPETGAQPQQETGYIIPADFISKSNSITVVFSSDGDNSNIPPGFIGRWKILVEAV